MWMQRFWGTRSGYPVRSHAWILIAMFRLAMDFTSCDSLGQGHRHPLLQRPALRYGFPHGPLWSLRSGQQARAHGIVRHHVFSSLERSSGQLPKTYHSKRLHKATDLLWKSGQPERLAAVKSGLSLLASGRTESLKRRKRYLRAIGKPTMEPEVIVWGSTSPLDPLESSTFPGIYESTTTTSVLQRTTMTTTMTTTTMTATVTTPTPATSTTVQPKGPGPGFNTPRKNPGGVSTMGPPATSDGNRKEVDAPPLKTPGDSSGLAVHQIITITVSLIMVIAALITTLVLKNCCAQSGNARRNGHQRKINQQEESCQNLTDFTPARVPSNLDIFTAYNETLQCSHECVRTPVPVYTEETILSPGDYKASFNGNRIPVVNL
ncbi:adherens junction-associated protein 1 isoform X2 [Sceloporus undulatus]|uniref:adherens junction-associated protein 1 isoform X2 n=1 Tax=Sceloporus undulatus TaxID=8520 RepID=UPI001C4BA4B1|nr:adherens junction-associated protein 1 isoform X2 [Sceloporus undulatus]